MKKLIIIFLLLIPCASWAASSRVLPTAYTEHTYDSAGGGEDYTSLATWEADTDTDLVTATSGYVLTCSSGVHNDSVAMDGATTSADYFRVIRGADGQRGTRTSGVRFETSSAGNNKGVSITENYVGIYDIGIKSVSTGDHGTGINSLYGSYLKIIGNTVYDCSGGVGKISAGILIQFGTDIIIANNYVYNCANRTLTSSGGISFYKSGTVSGTMTVYVYNNTVTNGTYYGFRLYQRTYPLVVYSKNNIFQDNGTNISTYGTPSHIQTTNATSGVTFDADGYHLASNDTGAIGLGTDLSADEVFAFDDDIDGETRSDWDIGADEYAAPSTGRRRIIMVQ